MTDNILVIKTGKQEINHTPFRVSLVDRRDGQGATRKMELALIKLHNVNLDIIDEVSINIGGTKIFSFESSEIHNIVLPTEGIYLSKCKYHNVDLYIHYNKKYIRDNSKIILEDEFEIEEKETNKIVYVRNPETGKVYPTNEFELIKKPTDGNKEVFESYPILEIPDIELIMKPMIESSEQIINIPIWQKYLVTPEIDTWEFIKSLVDRFQLKTDTIMSVEELYKKGKPFYTKIRNELRYVGDMAGLAYGF